MSIDIRPARKGVRLPAGSAASFTVTAEDDNGDPVDLSAHTLTLTPRGGTPIVATTADPETGTRVFSFTGAHTAAVDGAEPGRVSLTDSNGDEWWVGGAWADSNGAESQDVALTVVDGAANITLQVTAAIGGGGAVASVNGQTGEVVLTAEDVGAVEDDDPRLSNSRTPTGGAGGFLSDSYPNPGVNLEALHDAVAAMFQAGANVSVTYDDEAGTVTISATGGGEITLPIEQSDVDGLEDALASKATSADIAAAIDNIDYPAQVFAPFLYLPVDISGVGGSVDGDELTIAALGEGGPFPTPVGRSVLLTGQPNPAHDGTYRAVSESGTSGYSDGVLTRDPDSHQPFTAGNALKGVFTFNPFSNLPFVAQVISDGVGGYELSGIGVPPLTGRQVGDVLGVLSSPVGNYYAWQRPAVELYGAPALQFTGGNTTSYATENLGPLIDGLTIVAYLVPGNGDPGTYMEVLTQTRDGEVGIVDNFEAAIWVGSPSVFVPEGFVGTPVEGQLYMYWENTRTGESVESSIRPAIPIPGVLERGVPVRLLWHQGFASETMTMAYEVPYGGDFTLHGRRWQTVYTETDPVFDSIDPAITERWFTGLNFTGVEYELEVYDDATRKIAIDGDVLRGAVGGLSFTDAEGVEWTSDAGPVALAPEPASRSDLYARLADLEARIAAIE